MRDIDGRAQQVANPGAPIIAATPTLHNHHAITLGAGGIPRAYVALANVIAAAWRCVV